MGCAAYSRIVRLIALIVCVGAGSVMAQTNWVADPATPDDWFDAAAWSNGISDQNQMAVISNGGQATISYGSAMARELDLGGSHPNNGYGSVNITDGSLYILGQFMVGQFGSGLALQSGGTVNSHMLLVGNGGSGAYQLSGGGNLIAYNETIGNAGSFPGVTGTFFQSGGNNSCQSILSVASGSYYLSAGQINSLGLQMEDGNFNQTGGLVSVTQLILDDSVYKISNGATLTVTNSVQPGSVSLGGNSSFIQLDSTCNLSSRTLNVGNSPTATSSYTLAGNSQLYSSSENVGFGGTGIFLQTGGINNVSQSLSIGDGQYCLQGNSNLTDASLQIGDGTSHPTDHAVFTQSGGLNKSGTVWILPLGTYNLLSGALQTSLLNNSGTFDLQDPAAAGLQGINDLLLNSSTIIGSGEMVIEQNTSLYAAAIQQGSMTIAGKVQIAPDSATSILNSLSLTSTGSLDLTTNAMVLDYPTTGPSPLATVRAEIYTGHESSWTGPGIISSTLVGDRVLGIGYAEASALDVTTFAGVNVDTSAVLIRYTWIGDANLDGVVNGADLGMMSSIGSTWSSGDFNYDGVVNADDYALFSLGLAESGGTQLPLPEPALASFMLLLIPLRRRR